MSVKTKKRFKNLGKIVGIMLFALLMFTNIKVAMMDDTAISKGDISLFGIEMNLFNNVYASSGGNPCNLPCYYNYFDQECEVLQNGEYCVGAYGCPAELICHYVFN